jgi:hypothetical protein
MSYGATRPPLPPNTYSVELAVNDGTDLYNDAFWAGRCKQVPSTAPYVVVVMGTVVDYFRPSGGGELVRHVHLESEARMVEWSNDGVIWQTPGYTGNNGSAGNFNGVRRLVRTCCGCGGCCREEFICRCPRRCKRHLFRCT